MILQKYVFLQSNCLDWQNKVSDKCFDKTLQHIKMCLIYHSDTRKRRKTFNYHFAIIIFFSTFSIILHESPIFQILISRNPKINVDPSQSNYQEMKKNEIIFTIFLHSTELKQDEIGSFDEIIKRWLWSLLSEKWEFFRWQNQNSSCGSQIFVFMGVILKKVKKKLCKISKSQRIMKLRNIWGLMDVYWSDLS